MKRSVASLAALAAVAIALLAACSPAVPPPSPMDAPAHGTGASPGPDATATRRPAPVATPAGAPAPHATPKATAGAQPSPAAPTPTRMMLPPVVESLPNTAWSLSLLTGHPILANSTITLLFDDETLAGSGGCNRYTGRYSAREDGRLAVAGIAATERFCLEPEGLMAQEQAYLQSLPRTAAYRLTGISLELLDGAGQVLMVFAPQ